MKIIFARHGETLFSSEERFEGVSDSPLTDKGGIQIKKLTEFCNKEGVKKIYSSPLGRSLRTAEEIAKSSRLNTVVVDELREACYGEWEGIRKAELKKLKIWSERQINLFQFVHPGSCKGVRGESYEHLFYRLKPFLKKIEKEKKTTVIVSHIGVVRCAERFFENKLSNKEFRNAGITNDQVYIVEKNNTKLQAYKVNLL